MGMDDYATRLEHYHAMLTIVSTGRYVIIEVFMGMDDYATRLDHSLLNHYHAMLTLVSTDRYVMIEGVRQLSLTFHGDGRLCYAA